MSNFSKHFTSANIKKVLNNKIINFFFSFQSTQHRNATTGKIGKKDITIRLKINTNIGCFTVVLRLFYAFKP
jgi:hypothetical protein